MKSDEKIISQFLSDQGAVAEKMVTGCLRKIKKINICMKLAKIVFLLLMKIWDSVYVFVSSEGIAKFKFKYEFNQHYQ